MISIRPFPDLDTMMDGVTTAYPDKPDPIAIGSLTRALNFLTHWQTETLCGDKLVDWVAQHPRFCVVVSRSRLQRTIDDAVGLFDKKEASSIHEICGIRVQCSDLIPNDTIAFVAHREPKGSVFNQPEMFFVVNVGAAA